MVGVAASHGKKNLVMHMFGLRRGEAKSIFGCSMI